MIMSELEYLDSDCEMTVFPHPKAPGMAVVPPWTHLADGKGVEGTGAMHACRTGKGRPAHAVPSAGES